MATPTRIYHINIEGERYLVRAAHPSAALMHVARNVASVRVASQDDLVNCIADGIKVESAKDETPEPAQAPKADASLPLWPMPTPAGAVTSEADDEEADDQPADGYYNLPDSRAADGVPQRHRVAAKYRCPMTGSTWSGRGLKPTWLRLALDNGKQLADFEVAAQPA